MKRLWVISPILYISFLFAEEKTFIREYTYSALKQDTKETARRVALYEIKTLLLEEVGVFIQSELNIHDWEKKIGGKLTSGEFAEHKLTSITAGITKTEIIDEKWTKKWNKGEFYLRAKITLDPDDINNKISEIIENRDKLKELEEVKKKANDAYAEIERLKIELAEAKTEAEELKLTASYVNETNILKATELYNQGFHLMQMSMNNYDEAKDIFYQVIKIEPNFANAYFSLAVIYADKDNYDKVIQYNEKALELNPNNGLGYYNLGIAYNKRDNYDKAIQSYKKSIEIYPHYANSHFNLGLMYKWKDYNKAILSFNKVVEIDSFMVGVYYHLGDVYHLQENHKKAIQYYEKHIQFDPYDAHGLLAGTYHWLGMSYYILGNFKKAISALEKASELDPNDKYIFFRLGLAYKDQGIIVEAIKSIKFFNKAIELDPNFVKSYIEVGDVYLSLHKEAVRRKNQELIAGGKNLGQAAFYFRKAAQLGDKNSQDWLIENNLVEKNIIDLEINNGFAFDPELGEAYSGLAYLTFNDGSDRIVGQYKDGKKTGNWKYYIQGHTDRYHKLKFVDGVIDSVSYNDGNEQWIGSPIMHKDSVTADGIYLAQTGDNEYNFNLSPEVFVQMINNTSHGRLTRWWGNGQVYSEGNYIYGKKQGKFIWWYESGALKETRFWKNDEPIGITTQWYENGKKYAQGGYKNGMLHGELIWWYEDGQKKMQSTMNMGETISEKCWDNNGNIKQCNDDKKISRESIEKLVDKAQKEFSNEEYDKSINTTTEVIEKVLSVSVNNSEEFEKYRDEIIRAYFIRGQSYMLKKNYFESIPNFTNIINLDPPPIYNVLSLNRRFISNLVLGTRIKTLCEDLNMIDKLFSQHANTIDNERDQIINHNKMSDIEDNCDMWNDFANSDINDEDMEYLNTLAVILFQEADNPPAAISVAKEVVFRDPSRDNTYNNLGLFYYNTGRKEESVQYFNKAIDINPENISALITLSDYYYNINNLELSLKHARKAAQLGDKNSQDWLKEKGYEW